MQECEKELIRYEEAQKKVIDGQENLTRKEASLRNLKLKEQVRALIINDLFVKFLKLGLHKRLQAQTQAIKV